MSDGYEKIEERGSLTLGRMKGVYLVGETERPEVHATLTQARNWFELDSGRTKVKLNGSQMQTVRAWADLYI